MIQDKIQKLREAENKARRARIDAEEELNNTVLIPKLKTYIGKCFVYRNSFGGDREDWNLYIKVLRLDGTNFKTERFETKSNGEIEIELERDEYNWRDPIFEDSTYREISVDEYNKAKQALSAELAERGF